MEVAPACSARSYVASQSSTYRWMSVGEDGTCSLASPISIIPFPMATSACMIEPSGCGTRSRSTPSNALFKNSINCAAPLITMYGVMDVKPGRMKCAPLAGAAPAPDDCPGAVPSFMVVLLFKSDLSSARNSSLGRWRNSRATSASATRSRCGFSSGRGRSDTSMACTASSSCTARERLGMATPHLRPQALQRPQLQLLDRSLRLPEPFRDFPDAPLLDESLVHHAPLRL